MKSRFSRTSLLYGVIAAWAVLLVSCVTTSRTLFVPPHIPGAEIAGAEACVKCHGNITRGMHDATHAHLLEKTADGVMRNVSCESCHGPGSAHIKAGTRDTIVNPKVSPDTCLQCHANKRAEFSLPHAHPVLSGKISCSDCHEPHQGPALPQNGGSRSLAANSNATCAKCHPAQTNPVAFEHEAMREGCVTCHSPHGSVNEKMLRVRNASLCYQCHFQPQSNGTSMLMGGVDHTNYVVRGTCWTAGCHEAVHGSNVSSSLRF